MRKLFLFCSVLIVAISILIIKGHKTNTVSQEQHSLESYPMAAFELEMLKIRNPETGQVPPGALYKALKKMTVKHQLSRENYFQKKLFPLGWRAVNDFFANLAITKITYDPRNTSTYYFSTGEGWYNADAGRGAGIWKSTDAGKNWTQLESTDNTDFYYCQDMAIHPDNSYIYVATRNAGIQRSKDGGLTWQTVLSAKSGAKTDRAADIEFTSDGDIFVTMGVFSTDGIYYSESGDSASWELRMNGFPTSIYRVELATAASDPNRVYAIPVSSVSDDEKKIKGIFRSDDKGQNWYEINNPGDNYNLAKKQGWYDLIMVVDPQDENHIVCGGVNLWRSRDGGTNWEQLSQDNRTKADYVHVDQHEIVFVNSNSIYFGNDGGIYKCDNFTEADPEIYQVNNTYNVTQFYSAAIHPQANHSFIIGGTQDNGSVGATEDGISDFDRLSGSDGSFCAINYQNGNIFYTTTQYNKVYRTKYGDIDTITNPEPEKLSYLFINPIEIDPNDPDLIYQPTLEGVYRLKNASNATAENWEKAVRNWGTISAIGISKDIPNILFIGRSSGSIYKIENAHETDESAKPVEISQNLKLSSVYTSCIHVDPKDANHIIVVFSNYGIESVWETKNALAEDPDWESVEGDLPDIPIRWAQLHPTDPKVCYLATELGIFYTDELNGSETKWKLSNKGLANIRVDMIRLRTSDHTLVAATHGRGLFTGMVRTTTNEIIWNERGPQNVGGRTRSIMIDPNDPDKKKIWAGSVSGGLWVIDNIDNVNEGIELQTDHYDINVLTNPVGNGGSIIVYNSTAEISLKIALFDLQGQLLEVIHEASEEYGNAYINWQPAHDYRPGMYIIGLMANDRIKTSTKILML